MLRSLFCLLAFTLSSAAVDMQDTKLLYRERCSSCHQDSGHGLAELKVASIAGLPRWYVTLQLRDFRAGRRGKHKDDAPGQLMHGITQNLDDRKIAFLGKLIEGMKPIAKRVTLKGGEIKKGLELYTKNCATCHQKEAQGSKKLKAPPLNIQVDWYLRNQLKNFEKGRRKHHDKGKLKLKEGDEKDLITYLSSIKKITEKKKD